MMNEQSALNGGPMAVRSDPADIFTWPIVTEEDEEAVLEVLRGRKMSGTDITIQFENEFSRWQGTAFALGYNNGTASIQGAMFGCRIGAGDEIICPSVTYWASVLPVFSLGGTVVFADVDPNTLCIDPNDIEHRIGPNTKAILAVHYLGHPADMDPLMNIAKKHGLKVIEDVSHAQGGLYKGRKLGTIGDVGAMSLMTGKSLAIGEGGMLVTNDREIYERAVAFGHYTRFCDPEKLETEYLKPYVGLPLGGYKHRMHQMSAAMGRVQLKYYDERSAEIRKAMNFFWDQLEGVPGLRPHRVDESTGSNMAGWYSPCGLYNPDELGGLSVTRFCEAMRAEGVSVCTPGRYSLLHKHKIFKTCDIYNEGEPTRIANSRRDVLKFDGSLPVSERVPFTTFSVPWFKKYRPDIISEYASAFRKTAENYKELLDGDAGNPPGLGGWISSSAR